MEPTNRGTAMVTAVWSVKGGVGVSSVAAISALAAAERAEEVLLVDLCGDLPAVLGVDDAPTEPGLSDWCALGRPDGDAMARIETAVRPGLRLVRRGAGSLGGDPGPLMDVLRSSRRTIVVDCGLVGRDDVFRAGVVERSSTSLLVVRECFLNLRAVQRSEITPSGVVVLAEPRRHLGRADVESVAEAPVVAQIAVDPSIARSIDAGLVASRLPRSLLRTMSRVFDHAR